MAADKQKSFSLESFFETPSAHESLSVFRILVALHCIVLGLTMLPDIGALLSNDGWVSWQVSRGQLKPWQPHVQILANVLSNLGLNGDAAPTALAVIFLIASVFLLMGLFTRPFSIVAWFTFWMISNSMSLFTFGEDILLRIALFYLMLMPVNRVLSLDHRLGFVTNAPSPYATLSKRVLQIHLCLIYFAGGMAKVRMSEWLDGNAIWFSLTHTDFHTANFLWMAELPIIPKLLGWVTIILEVGYIVFMWQPKKRLFWFIGICLMHMGIGLFMSMPLFAAIMIIFSFGAWYDGLVADVNQLIKGRNKPSTTSNPPTIHS